MSKVCKKCGHPIVFSKGLCLKHWKEEYQKPLPTAVNNINKFSPKRKKLTKDYNDLIKKRDTINTHPFCFFCNKRIIGIVSHHHLIGRDGEDLINEKYIVDSHNSCHVEEYHQRSVEILVTYDWYDGFLLRLKAIDIKLWEKEIYKQVKANIMTLEQFKNLTEN
jgi:hypothetical protein